MVRRSGSNGLVLTYRRNRPTPTSRTWLRARWHFPRTWMVCPSPPGGAALLDAVPVLLIPGSYPLARSRFSTVAVFRIKERWTSARVPVARPRRDACRVSSSGAALPSICRPRASRCSARRYRKIATRCGFRFPGCTPAGALRRLLRASRWCLRPFRSGSLLDTGRFHFRRSAPCPTSQVRPPGFASHPLWLYCRLRRSRLPRSLCAASGPLSARPLRVSGSRSLRRLPRRVVDALDLALERCPCSFSSTP